MELWQEMMRGLIEGKRVEIVIPQISDPAKLFELKCYQALKEIKEAIEDDALEDKQCFMKIEAIVRVFEELGSDGGSRHDF